MMALTNLSSRLQKLPSTVEAVTFDYAELDSETRATVEQNTSEIKNLIRRTSQDIINIGQKLSAVKQQLEHGSFRAWLKTEFDWSISASTKFIQVSEQFKCVNFTHLNIANSALYLLAAPSIPDAARQEALYRAHQGETITYSKAKAITRQYKQVVKSESASVTIDVEAEGLDKALSTEMVTSVQSFDLVSSRVQPQSEERELQPKPQNLELLRSGDLLLFNSNNHLSEGVDHANSSTISVFNHSTDLLCQIFINHVELLTNAQIISVWYAIAHRLPSEFRSWGR